MWLIINAINHSALSKVFSVSEFLVVKKHPKPIFFSTSELETIIVVLCFLFAFSLIYIVDSNDPERFNEAHEELSSIVTDDRMRGVPVLLMANKQDLPNSRSVSEISERMKMHSLKDRAWHVQGCCAPSGDGILEGMSELSRMVKQFKKNGGSRY